MRGSPPAADSDPLFDGPIVLRHRHPAASARALAAQIGGTVAVGGVAVRDAVGRRLESIRLSDVAPSVVPDLDALCEAMRRAEAILERTRERVSANLARSLNHSLAIHPDTIRRAAGDLTAAERAIRRAYAGRPPGRALGLLACHLATIVGMGLGLMVAIEGRPLPGAALALSTASIAFVLRVTSLRRHRRTIPALASEVELALRRWHHLAGADADPDDLDRVLSRYDPQQTTIADLAARHPAVRAARSNVEERRRAWVRGWQASVGTTAAPPTAASASRTTLVLADPYDGLDDTEVFSLRRDLRRLGRDSGVVIVLDDVTVVASPGSVTIDLRPSLEAQPIEGSDLTARSG